MNNKMVILAAILVVLLLSVVQIMESTAYNGKEHIVDVDFTSQTENSAIYIYRDDCTFCKQIEDEVLEFYDYFKSNNQYDVYLADTNDMETQVWLSGLGVEIGTPTLLEIEGSTIVNMHSGAIEVPIAFETIMMSR